ncbi:MAG: endonuclease/exonuclease/phosphatase family protein [Bacteroidota bacterium]
MSAQTLKVLNYHLAEGVITNKGKANSLQQYMKRLDVDVAAFQEIDGITDAGLQALANKWKHPHTAILQMDQCAVAITSKYPLENIQKIKQGLRHGCLYAEVEGIGIYSTHLTGKNAQARTQEATLITQSMGQHAQESMLLLGALNSYAPQDSAYYAERWTRVAHEDRYKKDVILRIAGYQRKRNYKVLHQLYDMGLYDILAEKRGANATVETTYPTKSNAKDLAEYEQHRFDYILCSQTLLQQCEQVELLRNKTTHKLSKHYPVLATFQLSDAME